MTSFITGIFAIFCIYTFVIKKKSPKTILTKLGIFLNSSLNFLNKKINSISKTKNKRKPFFNKQSTYGAIFIAMIMIPYACIIILIIYGIHVYIFTTLTLLISTIAYIIYSDKRYG